MAGTRYFYRLTAIDGTGEGVVSPTVSTTPSLVVDNTAATGGTISAGRTTSTGLTGYFGSNCLQDGNTGGVGGNSVRFRLTLLSAGR